MLVVIGTDSISSCKSNYHTITTTAAPNEYQCLWLNNIWKLDMQLPMQSVPITTDVYLDQGEVYNIMW